VVVVACGDVRTSGTTLEPDAAGDGAESDAAVESPDDAAPEVDGAFDCRTWEPALPFEPCDLAAADRVGELVLVQKGAYTYETETDELLDPAAQPVEHTAMTIDVEGTEVQVLVVRRLQIAPGASLRARGLRPLVVAAWYGMEIAGLIDVSSGDGIGAGANPADCADGQIGQVGSADKNGGGGGGGGGFGGRGGDGGAGGGGNDGSGGSFLSSTPGLRGGCLGGDAAGQSGGTARGGQGGGAVGLSSPAAILVAGTLHAGGEGGDGGENGGGAGGGSGGMLWLDAPAIAVSETAILVASGGGGGSGGPLVGGDGEDGENARPDGIQAVGGEGAGGTGGGGSNDVPDGRVGETASTTGGGGGGGAGVIRATGELQVLPGALVVPAVQD
jgi:hypothetical protein